MKTGKSRGNSAGFASTPNERNLTVNQVVLRLLPFIALWAYGCSSTTEDGPSAEPLQIDGSWTYSARLSIDLGASGVVACSMSGVRISLSQSGRSVSGTAVGGDSTCDSPALRLETGTAANPVMIRGTVDGNSVRFEADGFVPLSHQGTGSGDSMSGRVRGTGREAGIGSMSVTGSWSASRAGG